MAQSVELPVWELWRGRWLAGGSRDGMLIVSNGEIASRLTDVVPRCPVEMTEEDRRRMISQGLSPEECTDDISIVQARVRLDKRLEIVDIMGSDRGSELSRDYVLQRLESRLRKTMKPGLVIYYIGHGKRNTGDWCFKDGFVTFRDIAELYSRFFNHRGLTIVTDCSHSGAWVDACLEYLDEQGVRPCGHSVKEKGILLKVYGSCEPTETAATNCFFVRAAMNEKNKGELSYYIPKELRESQHSYGMNTTEVRCDRNDIKEACTLRSDYTWQMRRRLERVYLVRGKDKGKEAWHYVMIVDDQETERDFLKRIKEGTIDVANYGQVLKSGWGKDPPNEVKDEIDRTYNAVYK